MRLDEEIFDQVLNKNISEESIKEALTIYKAKEKLPYDCEGRGELVQQLHKVQTRLIVERPVDKATVRHSQDE